VNRVAGVVRQVATSQVSKLLTLRAALLLLGFVASLVYTRLVVDHLGLEVYGIVALVVAIPLMIPFADFGLGASIVNAAARARAHGDADVVTTTVRRVRGIYVWIAGGLSALAVSVAATGWWSRLLGTEGSGLPIDWAVCVVLMAFALTLTVSPGTRVIQGLGRVGEATTFNTAATLTGTIIVAGALPWGVPFWLAVVAPSASSFLVNTIALARARSLLRRLGTSPQTGADEPPVETVESVSTLLRWGVAGMVIAAGVAAMTQGSRVILSHVGSPEDLAEFSLVWMVYAGANALVAVYGAYLWPRWRTTEVHTVLSRGALFREYRRAALLGLLLGLGFWVVTPPALDIFVGHAPTSLAVAAASACLFLQAIHQPAAMLLMTRSGMRWQALVILAITPISLIVSYVSIPRTGAAAPFLALALVVGFLQIPLTLGYSLKHLNDQSAQRGKEVSP